MPDTTDAEANDARARERRRAQAASNRSSTLLTSGIGLTDPAATQKAGLLGM